MSMRCSSPLGRTPLSASEETLCANRLHLRRGRTYGLMLSDPNERRTRRQLIKGAGALAVVAGAGTAGGLAIWRSLDDDGRSAGRAAGRVSREELAANIVSGGPGRDGIPPIDRPDFVAASRARFLEGDDVVFGIVHRGEARAYPQLVLVWHEIVNDAFGGERLSITYCPLTGSAVAFRAPRRRPRDTLGTTGNLVNSNLLMWDRGTESDWPQLLGGAIRGPLAGRTLGEVPLVWTTWERWRRRYPETVVLSTDTGYGRPYGDDPYGAYTPRAEGYYGGGGTIFPVIRESDRFPPKEVVVGVKAGDARTAVPERTIERDGVIPLQAGSTPLLAVWDDELATARVFVRRAQGRTLRFPRGQRRDAGGTTWTATGEASEGPLTGTRLRQANFVDVMWFAWYAFFPETEVVA